MPAAGQRRAMPRPVFSLRTCCWHAALPYLVGVSKLAPPTGCQLLLYYMLFESCIGRHRDNYTHAMMRDVQMGTRELNQLLEGSHHGGDVNSQAVGSCVLVYTQGNADMTFCLSFPTATSSSVKEYVVHPTFCVPLGAGTLLVFHPMDDLCFCHEAWLTCGGGIDAGDAGAYRLAFVFRWLTQARTFFTGSEKMNGSPERKERELTRCVRAAGAP